MESANDYERPSDRRGLVRERGGRFVCETEREEHNSWAHPSAVVQFSERFDVPADEHPRSLLLS